MSFPHLQIWIAGTILSAAIAARGEEPVHYQFQVTDKPAQRRFALTLKSTDKRPICIYSYRWPNKLGQVISGNELIILKTSEGMLRAHDTNFGSWAGDETDYIRLLPGQTLTGFIGYEQFGRPHKIAELKKRELHFPTAPFVCQQWPPPERDYRVK